MLDEIEKQNAREIAQAGVDFTNARERAIKFAGECANIRVLHPHLTDALALTHGEAVSALKEAARAIMRIDELMERPATIAEDHGHIGLTTYGKSRAAAILKKNPELASLIHDAAAVLGEAA